LEIRLLLWGFNSHKSFNQRIQFRMKTLSKIGDEKKAAKIERKLD
jgi:hypothetical protein